MYNGQKLGGQYPTAPPPFPQIKPPAFAKKKENAWGIHSVQENIMSVVLVN